IVAYSVGGGNCWNGVTDLGHNISSDATAHFTATGSRNSINPKLSPVAANGGLTKTMALQTNSPALDAADPALAPSIDQRGVSRPQGAGFDIGAFERVATVTNAAATFTISGRVLDGTNGL